MGNLSTLVAVALVIAALYYGRDIFQPLALSILLVFALGPLVGRLQRIRIPRIPAVLLVVLVVSLAIAGLTLFVAREVIALSDDLYIYQTNLQTKIRGLGEALPKGGTLEQATEAVKEIGEEIEQATQSGGAGVATATPGGGIDVQKPVPVEIQERAPTTLETFQGVLGPLVGPLVTASLIIVFVIFMLIERTELRDRLIRLLDADDLTRANRALDDAAKRVSRYLLMQLLIAAAYGLPYGLGLWAIGVPNPLLWGLLATVLRFIPYVGPVLAAAFPLLLALGVDPGWNTVILTAALIAALELFTSNALEPWLYGSTTGLSPVAILVAAVFWTTLWGPVGLLLSVPLTVCLVVLARHVPQLAVLDLLLGDRPALSRQERIYQRLLAGDRHEARQVAEAHGDEHGFASVADEVLIPVLRLADLDRERQSLDVAGQERVAQMVETIGGYLADGPGDPRAFEAAAAAPGEAAPGGPPAPRVLCVGARHGLDLASAALLGHALEAGGLDAKAVPYTDLRPGAFLGGSADRATLACVATLAPLGPGASRRLVRRLKSVVPPGTPVILCAWTAVETRTERPEGVDAVVSTVAHAVEEARARLGLPAPTPAGEAAAGAGKPGVEPTPAAPALPAPAGA